MNRYFSQNFFKPPASAPARVLGVLALSALAISPFLISPAFADVFGRLHIVVKNGDTEKPLAGAKVTLHDPANVHPDVTLTTDANGSITTDLLENRAFTLATAADNFQADTKQVTVASDTTSDVEIVLDPVEKTIKVSGNRTLLRRNNTANVTSRPQSFIQQFPTSPGNRQQITGLTLTNPGFAQDSNNQAHPRGEHTATSVYLNGFLLGNALQGRFGPLITQDAIQNVDILTGAFAPEYGSETAAVLNTTIRSGTIKPTYGVNLDAGGFNTREGSFTIGGQMGGPLGAPDAAGNQARRFGYFITGSARSTDNALEPPQPDDQTAHNHGDAQAVIGRFDYTANSKDKFTLTMDEAPASTQVANRTGLPSRFASVGQGFGFGGALSRADARAAGIGSQEDDGQDINQHDSNQFGVLQWRHSFNDTTTSMLSFGLQGSSLNVTNNNPGVNLNALPADNSIEYNPNVRRESSHIQAEGSLTKTSGQHTYKFGFVDDEQHGNESYQLTPASQLALDSLFANSPLLAPSGTPQVDGGGNPVLDSQGNQVYLITPGAKAPRVNIKRSGAYRAAYLQDTWRVTRKLTANYGLRYDSYNQTPSIGKSISEGRLSPRLNLSYSVQPTVIVRAAYNRLFIQPPLAEGANVGDTIKPEILNQYDLSIEKQIKSNQTVKLAYYYKQIQNQVDVALLIPGSQIGIYRAVNLERDNVHGIELSYDLQPHNGVGLGGFLAFSRSTAKFFDAGESGFNDHDQRYTVSTGLSYAFKNGASLGTVIYYGSGLASSALAEGGPRESRTRVNFDLSTGPRLFGGKGGLRLDVENLFNDRSLVNFNSDFSGTRFQQGRRVVLGAFANF